MDQNQQQNSQPVLPTQPNSPIPQENPGQTLGIVSIIMIFVFPLLGIVFGVMSRNKSKAVGMPSGLGTTGMVINIVVTALSVVLAILFIVLVVMAGASESSKSTPSSNYPLQEAGLSGVAKEVAKRAGAYKLQTGDYPKSTTDFDKYTQSTLPTDIEVFSSLLLTSKSLTYIYCGQGAAQIVYLGNSEDDKRITAIGSASTTEVCPKSY